MDTQLRKRALEYLNAHHVMTLATAGPEGLWAAAVFYVNEGFDLYFLSSPASRHSLNIAAHPGVAATIQEDYIDWPEIKGIQLEGFARRITGTEQATALTSYGNKYPVVGNLKEAPEEIIKAMKKIAWYRLVPSKLYYLDNSLGFGHRGEVPLQQSRN